MVNNKLFRWKETKLMGQVQMKSLMAELKLSGMAMLCEKLLTDAKKMDYTVEETLDSLLQAEADHRRQRRAINRVKASKIRGSAGFEDFDFAAKRSITKAQVKELISLNWLSDARPVVLIGQTGVEKTFLAQAVGLRACDLGKTVLFLSVTHWLELQADARSTGVYLKFREKMIRPDLLILDDFGMRKFSAVEAEDFREILEERAYNKSTLVTTQLPMDHWAEVIPDPVLADAITDRMEGPSLIYKITGESYRKIKAQKLAPERKEN